MDPHDRKSSFKRTLAGPDPCFWYSPLIYKVERRREIKENTSGGEVRLMSALWYLGHRFVPREERCGIPIVLPWLFRALLSQHLPVDKFPNVTGLLLRCLAPVGTLELLSVTVQEQCLRTGQKPFREVLNSSRRCTGDHSWTPAATTMPPMLFT